MANSKAYLSFVLLFAFLLSSHVLAHELHETSPKNQRSHNDEGIFKHPNPTLSRDLEIDWRGGSSMPSFRHLVGSGSKTPRLEHDGYYNFPPPEAAGPHWATIVGHPPATAAGHPPTEESIRLDNAEVDELKESKSDWNFPRASRKTMLGTGRGHYTHSVGYSPSRPVEHVDLCEIYPEICEGNGAKREMMRDDGNVRPEMRPSKFDDGNVGTEMRHSKIDWRAFPAFPVKTLGMRHGGKTGYGVPRKEDVGGETMN